MAALNRPTTANYEVHEKVRVDTQDNEDHTFCGILFPVKAKNNLPVSQLVLHSVAVRGALGPLTVWVSRLDTETETEESNNNNNNLQQAPAQDSQNYRFRLHPRYWEKIYEATHEPSLQRYVTLDFSDHPVILKPGQVRALYIHSTMPNDEAIVYDNAHHMAWRGYRATTASATPRYQDRFLSIHSGKAHLSPRVFGSTPIWGWGTAWRDHREFVGQVNYGTVYQLWQPPLYKTFGPAFQTAARTLFACQRRWESPVSRLPDECLFYILNLCRWDWFDDTSQELQQQRRQRRAVQRQRERQARRAALEREQQARAGAAVVEAAAAQAAAATTAAGDRGPCPCANNSNKARDAFFDAPQEEGEETTDAAIVVGDGDAKMAAVEEDDDDDDDDDDDEESIDDAAAAAYQAMQEEDEAAMDEEEDYQMSDVDGQEDDDDDDDMNDDEWLEDDDDDPEDDEDEDDDDDDEDAEWGHRPYHGNIFHFHDASSDEEDDDDNNEQEAAEEQAAAERQAWFRRNFARIHILRALASAEAQANAAGDEEGQEADGDNEAGRVVYWSLQDILDG